jgi:hypothetical protein
LPPRPCRSPISRRRLFRCGPLSLDQLVVTHWQDSVRRWRRSRSRDRRRVMRTGVHAAVVLTSEHAQSNALARRCQDIGRHGQHASAWAFVRFCFRAAGGWLDFAESPYIDGELAACVLTEGDHAGKRPDMCPLPQCLAVQHREFTTPSPASATMCAYAQRCLERTPFRKSNTQSWPMNSPGDRTV